MTEKTETAQKVPAPPNGKCKGCGSELEYRWTENIWILKAVGLTVPSWVIMECEVCEEKRVKERRREENERIRLSRMERIMTESYIPERLREKTIEDFEVSPKNQKMKEAVERSVEFVNDFDNVKGRGLILMGKVGTGKGHLAAGICKKLIEREKSIYYCKVPMLFMAIKATFGKDEDIDEVNKRRLAKLFGANEFDIVQNLCEYDLLWLDELGVQSETKWEMQVLYSILDGRYEKMKSTLITTNLKWTAIEGVLGDRIIDRFFEDGGKAITFDWESYRRKGREEKNDAK